MQHHALSEDCWKIVENWISTCTTEHGKCSQPSTLPLPTRVIDVSGLRPTLVDGRCISGPYTALSHCWGQGHHPLSHTTTQTINDFRIGIDVFDLPATFRDAIEVTRRLKVKYLWIDSLCIIQDLIEDWQREAQRMGSYYQKCILNISALDAPESDTGFLLSRQAHPTVQLEGNFYMRPARRSWRKVFQDSPLSRRAWVLQERLVSTRVLHFGRDDMFWECLTCSTRESDSTEHKLTDQDTEWLDENFKRSLQFSRIDVSVALHKWYKVVAQYTKLSMSHESDMLPAISAIAGRIRQATEYTYLAGLWMEDLHQGLLWYADGPRSAPRIWRAPSWSWAQLNGPILHLFSPTSSRVPSKYDLKISNSARNNFAESENTKLVRDTELAVEGFTGAVWIKGSHGNPPYNNPSLKLIVDIYDQHGMPIGTGFLDMLIDENPIRPCEALAISQRSDKEVVSDPWLSFLMIEPVDEQPKVYRRIGVGQTLEPFHRTLFDGSHVFDQDPPRELTLI